MNKAKRNNEALYQYQQMLRRYCDKEMISTVHLVRIMSILCKAWCKATEIGFEEGRNDAPNQKLLDALVNTKGEGRYNVDKMIHASNTIEDMKQIAKDAIDEVIKEDKQ